jgi:TatD DNase family protein
MRPLPFFSCGLHPWNVERDFQSQIELLEKLLDEPGCVALGECGLDRLKGPDLDLQLQVFSLQAALAEKHRLPIIIHCVRAWDELRTIKRTLQPTVPWIWHGFNRPKLINAVINEGFFLSLGADLIRSEALKRVVEEVPMNRILLESDDSAYSIEEIYRCLATLKQLPLSTVEDDLFNNIKHIFPKWITGLNALSY